MPGLIREDGNQSRDGQPQEALDQKEKKSPKAQSLDPGLKAHLILASLREDDQPSEVWNNRKSLAGTWVPIEVRN